MLGSYDRPKQGFYELPRGVGNRHIKINLQRAGHWIPYPTRILKLQGRFSFQRTEASQALRGLERESLGEAEEERGRPSASSWQVPLQPWSGVGEPSFASEVHVLQHPRPPWFAFFESPAAEDWLHRDRVFHLFLSKQGLRLGCNYFCYVWDT